MYGKKYGCIIDTSIEFDDLSRNGVTWRSSGPGHQELSTTLRARLQAHSQARRIEGRSVAVVATALRPSIKTHSSLRSRQGYQQSGARGRPTKQAAWQ